MPGRPARLVGTVKTASGGYSIAFLMLSALALIASMITFSLFRLPFTRIFAVVLGPLIKWAETIGSDLPDLEVRRPSLEDVYLTLTAPPAQGS